MFEILSVLFSVFLFSVCFELFLKVNKMNEDLIIWGMCGAVLLSITILSYITHLIFKPKETKPINPTPATLKWVKQLRKRSVFPGVIRSLFTSNGARVSIEELEQKSQPRQ